MSAWNSTLKSSIAVASDGAGEQLLSGFYEAVDGAWRWTAPRFSVELPTPPDAGRSGASVLFAFALPKARVERTPATTLRAAVGTSRTAQTFSSEGDHTLELSVAPRAISAASMVAEFSVDEPFRPGGRDQRECGVIAVALDVLGSLISFPDEGTSRVVLRGFYPEEATLCQWTRPTFTARLAVPAGALQSGAILRLAFSLPPALILQHPTISVSASIQDCKKAQAFAGHGDHVLDLHVPAGKLSGATALAQFSVDKVFVPGGADQRLLGVLARSIELIAK